MPLTTDQQRLRDTLAAIAEIDAEMDYMASQQGKIDARRKALSVKRVEHEGAVRLAHTTAGCPKIAIQIRDRILCFDHRTGGVISFPNVSAITFAVMACREPEDGEDGRAVELCQSETLPSIEEDA